LGCDYFRDPDGTLCYSPKSYIERATENYRRLFGQNPKPASAPLVKGDHPEVDESEILDEENTKIYQSLIGMYQWAIQIGRMDICTSTMTMSRFRAMPKRGHFDRLKRMAGYLYKMVNGTIRVRTDKPDYSGIPEVHYDWEDTIYKGAKEEVPWNAPEPLGKSVKSTHYFDANLWHDIVSGRSVTGILHVFNKTPIDWYSKLQSTVETATFGSEYIAARTCVDQIIDLRNVLRYLGVPIDGPAMMFGDNETVVKGSSIPHIKLHKRHNALSYHRVRHAQAAGIIRVHYIPGSINPADILSKHWDYSTVWPILRPILFWEGDTAGAVYLPGETDFPLPEPAEN
jgi:hypothetical protein